MSTKSTAMVRALKAKFGSPAAVLAKLGLDSNLLDENLLSAPPAAASNNTDAIKKVRAAIEQVLSDIDGRDLDEKSQRQIGHILELLNKLDDDDPNLAGDDETPEEKEQRFAKFLSDRGFGEDDIRRACDHANGKPQNVFQAGSLRGSQLAGDSGIMHLVSRISHEPEFGSGRRTRQVEVLGMDAAAVDELHKMFPGIERIQH